MSALSLATLPKAEERDNEFVTMQGATGPIEIPRHIIEKAEAGEWVEVLVLLEERHDKETDLLSPQSAAQIARMSDSEYATLMAQRTRALNRIKRQFSTEVGNADIEPLTEYSVLPVVHLRLRSMAALKRLAEHPRILSIDPIQYFEKQLAVSLPLIKQPPAEREGADGAGTTVCVLDSGVDFRKPAFGSCAAPGGNCKVAVARGFSLGGYQVDDHGTHVAGTVLGAAPAARIAALDVFGTEESTSTPFLISAIDWCVSHKAQYHIAAINMSLGGGRYPAPVPPTDAFGMSIRAAVHAGITVVAASGNDAYHNAMRLPAAYSNVVSVGAVYSRDVGFKWWASCIDFTTAADRVACFSNSALFLDLLAPGAMITAAGITNGGTSMASPHVAGAAAVLRQHFPRETVAQLIQRLKNGAPVTDHRNGITAPRLDLVQALDLVEAQSASFRKTLWKKVLPSALRYSN